METTIEDKKALLDKAGCIIIHSGNVLFQMLQTSEEICKSFCGVVNKWIEKESDDAVDRGRSTDDTLSISSQPSSDTLLESRDQVKITVKLFLQGYYSDVIYDAIDRVIEDLQCEKIDTVLLSLPQTNKSSTESLRSIKYEDIQSVWLKLQELVENKLVSNLGVCDFDVQSLKDLYESCKVKPIINQLSLDQCCTPPEDLVSFSSSNNIELLTHNDPTDILPPGMLKHVLPKNEGNRTWKAMYLLKYSCVVKLREVVKSKGYILCLKRTNEELTSCCT